MYLPLVELYTYWKFRYQNSNRWDRKYKMAVIRISTWFDHGKFEINILRRRNKRLIIVLLRCSLNQVPFVSLLCDKWLLSYVCYIITGCCVKVFRAKDWGIYGNIKSPLGKFIFMCLILFRVFDSLERSVTQYWIISKQLRKFFLIWYDFKSCCAHFFTSDLLFYVSVESENKNDESLKNSSQTDVHTRKCFVCFVLFYCIGLSYHLYTMYDRPINVCSASLRLWSKLTLAMILNKHCVEVKTHWYGNELFLLKPTSQQWKELNQTINEIKIETTLNNEENFRRDRSKDLMSP